MPRTIGCPTCPTKLKVPDDADGRRVKCPKCGGVMTIPRSGVEPTPTDRLPDATPTESVQTPPPAASAPTRARRVEVADDRPPPPTPRAEPDDRPRRPRDEADDDRPARRRDEAPFPKKVKFPPAVKLAGLAWVIVGILQLVGVAGGIFEAASEQKPLTRPGQGQVDPQTRTVGLYCGAGIGLLVGLAFGITGIQALGGSVSSVTGAGVASLILGVLGLLGIGATMATTGPNIPNLVGLVAVSALVAGGICAIVGGKQYAQWRKWKKADTDVRKGKRRPPSRRDEDDDRGRDEPRPAASDRDDDYDRRDDNDRPAASVGPPLHKGWKSVALGYRMLGLMMLCKLIGVPAAVGTLVAFDGVKFLDNLYNGRQLNDKQLESLLVPFAVAGGFAFLIGLFAFLAHIFLMGMPKNEKGGQGKGLAVAMFILLLVPGLYSLTLLILPAFSAGVGTALNKPRLSRYGWGLYAWYAVGLFLVPLLTAGAFFGMLMISDGPTATVVAPAVGFIIGLLAFLSVWSTYAGLRRGIQASIRDRGIVGGEEPRPVKKKQPRRVDEDFDESPPARKLALTDRDEDERPKDRPREDDSDHDSDDDRDRPRKRR